MELWPRGCPAREKRARRECLQPPLSGLEFWMELWPRGCPAREKRARRECLQPPLSGLEFWMELWPRGCPAREKRARRECLQPPLSGLEFWMELWPRGCPARESGQDVSAFSLLSQGWSFGWSCGREAEGGGLLNRYRVVKPYRGFESLRLRQLPVRICAQVVRFHNYSKAL